MRFSIRFMLLLTAAFAILMFAAIAWQSQGALIGPLLLISSFAIAFTLSFATHSYARTGRLAAIVLFCLVVTLYLSIGPASWVMARYIIPDSNVPDIVRIWTGRAYSYTYIPVATNAIYAPKPVRDLSFGYIQWWMPKSVEFDDMGYGMGWSDGLNWYTIIRYGNDGG